MTLSPLPSRWPPNHTSRFPYGADGIWGITGSQEHPVPIVSMLKGIKRRNLLSVDSHRAVCVIHTWLWVLSLWSFGYQHHGVSLLPPQGSGCHPHGALKSLFHRALNDIPMGFRVPLPWSFWLPPPWDFKGLHEVVGVTPVGFWLSSPWSFGCRAQWGLGYLLFDVISMGFWLSSPQSFVCHDQQSFVCHDHWGLLFGSGCHPHGVWGHFSMELWVAAPWSLGFLPYGTLGAISMGFQVSFMEALGAISQDFGIFPHTMLVPSQWVSRYHPHLTRVPWALGTTPPHFVPHVTADSGLSHLHEHPETLPIPKAPKGPHTHPDATPQQQYPHRRPMGCASPREHRDR